jgi:hypothetical protein
MLWARHAPVEFGAVGIVVGVAGIGGERVEFTQFLQQRQAGNVSGVDAGTLA